MSLSTEPLDPVHFEMAYSPTFLLNEALQSDDADYIASTLRTLLEGTDKAHIARMTGKSRTTLLHMTRDNRQLSLPVLLRVLKALGFRMVAEPITSE